MKNQWIDKTKEDKTEEFDLPDNAYDAIEVAAMQASILFRSLGWTWLGSDTPPTLDEIKTHFQGLVQSCIQENLTDVRGGRLGCHVSLWDSDTKEYTLFIDCSSFIDPS